MAGGSSALTPSKKTLAFFGNLQVPRDHHAKAHGQTRKHERRQVNNMTLTASQALARMLRFRSVEVSTVEGIQEDGLQWATVRVAGAK